MKRLLFLLTAFAACGSPDEGVIRIGNLTPLAPPRSGQGMQLTMQARSEPGKEVWKCIVLDGLPVPGNANFVNMARANHRQSAGMHHMDLMVLEFTGLHFAPGEYDCADIYKGENTQLLMDKGIIIYASQQAEDAIILPEGVVAQVPTRSQFLFEMHYVNSSDKAQDVGIYLNAHFVPDGAVRDTIWGGPIRDLDIDVPARAQNHIEWTRCKMNKPVDVVIVSSHTHELAKNFEIRFFDGLQTREPALYVNRDWQSPFLRNFSPPLHVEAGQGFEFRCNYSSHRDEVTRWGLYAKDEMCQMAVVFTPGDAEAKCEVSASGTGTPPS